VYQPPILDEVRGVLTRDKLRRQFSTLTAAAVDSLIDDIRAAATLIDPVPATYPLPRDPKDEKYIDAMIAANATYLVTRDKDLLALRTDEFRTRYPAVIVVAPAEFLKVMNPPPTDEADKSGAPAGP
jgi:putative PIN family toxin of toxin-antitoxin system